MDPFNRVMFYVYSIVLVGDFALINNICYDDDVILPLWWLRETSAICCHNNLRDTASICRSAYSLFLLLILTVSPSQLSPSAP